VTDSSSGSSLPRLRAHWTNRLGFILAASGSAVGLGNIWKFPYITGVYGGGAFVLVYLVAVLIVGLPLMIAELIIGRHAQENPVGAFQDLHRPGSPWQLVGWLGILSGFIILSFYSVIAGWGLAYIVKAVAGFSGTTEEIGKQFNDLISNTGMSVFWHTIFMIMTVWIVAAGVKKGIELWSKILMPALLLILIGLSIYGLAFTQGGGQALNFLFRPDFHKLTGEGILSALGHAFFTLSLGMGAMITYGSYMERGANIVRDAVTISILDTVVALLAGIAIFSVVFSSGLEPGAGPGLIFQTLPELFSKTGRWVSIPFFLLLAFAALTSAISLLEVVVSYFIDRRGWTRVKACLIMGGVIWGLGILSCIQATGMFDFFDVLTTNYTLPIGGLLIAVFVAFVMKDKDRLDELGGHRSFWYKAFLFTVTVITPLAVLVVLLHGVGMF
jgi:NSS family neurotransmitter:Na+ symporter